MNLNIIFGAVAVLSLMGAVLVIVVNKNRKLRNENKEKDKAIKQRDDNKHSFESLQDKVKDIRDEANNNSPSSNSSFNELPKH